MANGQNMTAEEFTTSVAEAIAAQLKIDASALVTRLVDSLSKGLIKEFTKKGPVLAEKSKTPETSKATKQDSAKLPKIEISLPKMLENQFSKIDDISKSLNKLIDKTATVKKEDKFPEIFKKLIPKEQKPDTSLNVLGGTLEKILGAFKAPSKKEEVLKEVLKPETSASSKKETTKETPKVEAPKSLLEQKVEAQPVIIAGISESGLKDLSENLPDIIKEGVNGLIEQLAKKADKEKKEKPAGGEGLLGMLPKGLLTTLGLAGGGIALLLGGVAALVTGLMNDGPFKGLLKIVSQVGIAGGLKLLEKSAGMFLKNINNFIKAPIKLLAGVAKSIGGLFGAEGAKAALKTVASGKGIFSTMLKGISNFLKGAVKKLPVIGSVISIGFAVSRFLKGDVVGGTIDMLSAVASLVPFVGMPIAIGLDVLNAVLDAKTGGASPESSQKKSGILKEWAKAIGEKMYAGLIDAPIFGPMIKAGKHLYAKEWMQGLKQIAYIVPGFEFVGALLGDTETTGGMQQLAKGSKKAANWIEGIGAWIGEKMLDLPIIGPAIKAVQALFAGDFTEALKQFTHINPLVGMLEQFLQTDTGKDVSKKASGGLSKAMDFFSSMKDNILSKVLEFIPETVWGYPLRAKVAELFGIGPKANIPESAPITTGAPSEPAPSVQQVGDAKVKPDGGLVVSSPTEGSLYQLSKNDGIVAGPVTDDPSSPKSSSIASTAANIGNSDKILTQIANNTETTNKSIAGLANGFNVLAKSLEKLGVSVAGQSPTVINNVSGGSKGGSSKVSSSQIASAGNSAISSFRSGIEASRFVPA